MFRRLTLLAVLASAPSLHAQDVAAATDSSIVTLDRLFNSDFFSGDYVPPIRWTPDGQAYYSYDRREGAKGPDLVRVNPATGDKTVLVRSEQLTPPGDTVPLRMASFRFSSDGRKLLVYTNTARVWRQNTRGDYWVLDLGNGKLTKLGGRNAAPSTLMFAKFSPQGDRVAYVREHNLYVERIADGQITPLTKDGSAIIINGTFDWVYEEEFDDRDGFRWSPDGKRIAYWQLDASGVRDFLLINDTDSLYSFVKSVQYPKAGTTNSSVRIGVVNADGGSTKWMQVPGDPRNIYLARMEWASNSDQIVMQHLNRLQNTLDRPPGRREDWPDHADAGGPRQRLGGCGGRLDLARGREAVALVQRPGWLAARLHRVAGRQGAPADHRRARTISPMSSPWTPPAAGSTSPPRPTTRRSAISTAPASTARHPRSDSRRPTSRGRTTTASRRGRNTRCTCTAASPHHPSPNWSAFPRTMSSAPWRTTPSSSTASPCSSRGRAEFFRVDAGNGVTLDGFVMYPVDFDSTKKYPVLFTSMASPRGRRRRTAGTPRIAWHLMLTQQGYAVITRRQSRHPIARADGPGASRSTGRSGCMHRRIRPARRGRSATGPGSTPPASAVWGWSGGGSMTLNLMFRYSGRLSRRGWPSRRCRTCTCYDTIYQERYMGLPQDNADGLQARVHRSPSPTGCSGNLLVVHGSGDDNVHYQGTERLVNALVAANKPFTMMAYPNRTHGIFEGEGTTLHLFSLLTRYLTEHLPAGGVTTHPAGYP